ncbi:MAG: hypothetical protein LBT46_06470 [Planctomycetaceae bacterium]|jgi:hypothetical protein|nr:hypothetical protein [Planctomycetaceae bacterium]
MRLSVFQLFCLCVLQSVWCCASDVRLQFNYAAGLLQEGKYKEAAELLHQTATAADKDVAAKSSALLGQIDVAEAKGTDGNTEHFTELLDRAEEHFTDSIVLQDNADVRKNLENLRVWRVKTADEQKETERIQNRNAELQERIQRLANEENSLITVSQQAADESVSPKLLQQNYESAKQQHFLAEDIAYLPQTPSDTSAKDNDAQDKEQQEQFRRLPEIQKIAEDAAKHLAENKVKEALMKQREVYAFLQSLLHNQNSSGDNSNNQNQDKEKENKNQQSGKPRQDGQQADKTDKKVPPEQSSNKNTNNTEQNEGQQKEPETSASALKEEEANDAAKKAERMLLQVRRKQQEAEKRRDHLKMLQQKSNPVEKDW